MKYTEDELLFIETLKEIGVEFQEGKGEITIEGIPAAEYLETRDIFDAHEKQYISLDISSKEILKNEVYTFANENLLQAA